jgi:hypothetical protein
MATKKAKKSKKKSSKSKVNKRKQKARYSAALVERMKLIVTELQAVSTTGKIAWPKVAKVLGISQATLYGWKNPLSDLYRQDFARACAELVEDVEAGRIKRGLIEMAKPHTTVEATRVLKEFGPKPPPRSWTKKALVMFARLKLGMELEEQMGKGELFLTIEAECDARRTEKMVTVRERRKREVDTKAASIVLPNIGPPETRWMVKEGRMHDATGELARLLDEIGRQQAVLPCEELGLEPANEYKRPDRSAIEGEAQVQNVADEQPVQDY